VITENLERGTDDEVDERRAELIDAHEVSPPASTLPSPRGLSFPDQPLEVRLRELSRASALVQRSRSARAFVRNAWPSLLAAWLKS